MRTFVQELKNRRVYRVAIAYLVGGSAVVQLAGTVFPMFHAPEWFQQVFVVLIAICFPAALGLAWSFDLRGGIERTVSIGPATSAANSKRLWLLLAISSFIAVAGLAGYWLWHPWRTEVQNPRTAAVVSGKSIAVLPFENLSSEKDAGYFTEGVQDEILTHLSRVADLKVISRTSVMQFKSGTTRNLRAIAAELGVAHILEGSVQRANGRVRISAQLIDARADAHVWAERYDRELADIFGLQTEVAEKIVSQLKARLSPIEKAALQDRPTHDLAAYELYLRARNLIEANSFSARAKENLLEATRLLQQAVARDPAFLLAHYQLATAQDQIYFFGIDHTTARLELADAAVQSALRLRPDSGEAHLALAQHLYWGYRDYDRAREELATARRLLPNEPAVLMLAGFMDRRQGRWDQSIQEMERAVELDPRNIWVLQQVSISYQNRRRYNEAAASLDRIVAIAPKDLNTRVWRAVVELEWHADTRSLHAAMENVLTEDPAVMDSLVGQWILLILCERDRLSAQRALDAIGPEGTADGGTAFPKAWYEAIVARALGDSGRAQAAFTVARDELEKTIRDQPNYAQAFSLLGMIDAGLGRKEEAIREGRRATELLPISKDTMTGPAMLENLAVIYAWTGEKEQACAQLAVLASMPGNVTYGGLRLHPFWDPMRGEACFEKIIASLAPKQ